MADRRTPKPVQVVGQAGETVVQVSGGLVPGLTADAVAMGRDFAFAIEPAG